MSNDTELLRRYVEQGSESAFAELVREHLNLVYSAALREANGDGALAEDISQAIFADLARQARRLLDHPSLAGWLYTSVRHFAANLRRAEQRRRDREQEVHTMNALLAEDSPGQAWRQIRPVLDDALHELNEEDRAALVLRFLEDRSLREVGDRLGLQENTARMRVDRALDKLRGRLERRGITSTAAGLTAALAVGAVTPAPSALAGAIASASLASGVAAGSTTLTLMKLMSISKVSLIGAVVAAGIAVPVWQQTRLHRVQSENAQLRAQETELAALRAQAESVRKAETNQAELERLRQWQAQTQPELLRLRAVAGAARRAEAEVEQLRAQLAKPANPGEPGPGTNHIAGAMTESMQQAMDLDLDARVARMAASLHLTLEQAQAVRDILGRRQQMMRQVFAGGLKWEEVFKATRAAGNPEQEIQGLLTPDQKAAYPNYKQDESAFNARRAANAELLQIDSVLNLNSEQSDRVFAALYEQSLNQLTGRTPPSSSNQDEAVQWYLDQKTKALEPILTPAQLEIYKQQQTTQAKMVKDVLNKMKGAEGAGAAK